MRESVAPPNVLIKTSKRKSHTVQVKTLLVMTQYSAREIAEMCGCSYQLVTHVRRQLNLPHANQTREQMLARLERELRDLRRKITAMAGSLDEWEATLATDADRCASGERSCAPVCISSGRSLVSKS